MAINIVPLILDCKFSSVMSFGKPLNEVFKDSSRDRKVSLIGIVSKLISNLFAQSSASIVLFSDV